MTDDRYNVLLRRIRALSLEHRSDALVYLSGYAPDQTERALDQIDAWNAATAPPAATPCPVCGDSFIITVAGPDENGNYDVDDCPCQTGAELDPEERWYAMHDGHDGWVS